ncbi:hypothetical protein NE237_012579 [Protea cynaroides]|uniref:F-box domain-containing protein n=1 Tax=Protea cynaroides TaxID=273540 RepID=A0A9Q0GZD7_9MAGN|nr:hypothetical protein NE237_012579 [Protea cynaroides]
MEQAGTTVLVKDCIVDILSRTSPRDACRLSVVSSIFRSAADSDSVWERFLPSDMQLILSSSVSPSLPNFSSKKQQFLYLCGNPLLIDNRAKTFVLEKCSGKKCYMIRAKELSFNPLRDTLFFIQPSLPESRFSEVVELTAMNWFEIRGEMETRWLSPNTTYVAYLVFKLANNAEGFGYDPVEMSVRLASCGCCEHPQVKYVYLTTPKETTYEPPYENPWWPLPQWGVPEESEAYSSGLSEETEAYSWGVSEETDAYSSGLSEETEVYSWEVLKETEVPKKRGDGWMEIEMGEFFNERGDDGEVEMRLKEVKFPWWQRGLIVEGIELRPKENQ